MKYCFHCGQPLADDAAFCSKCGAQMPAAPASPQPIPQPVPQPVPQQFSQQVSYQVPQPAAPVPEPGKRSHKKAVILSVTGVLVAALAVAGIVAWRFFSSPRSKFLSYHAGFLSHRIAEPLEAYAASLEGASLDTDLTVTAGYSGEGSEYITPYLDGTSLSLDLKASEDDGLVAGASLELMGRHILSGCFTFNDGVLGVYLPDLSSSYYVADLERMIYNLTGTQVELPDVKAPDISEKQLQELAGSFGEILLPLFDDGNFQAERNVAVELSGLGQSATCTVYSFRPQAAKVEQVCLDLAAALESDQQLLDVFSEYISSVNSLYAAAEGGSAPLSAGDMLRQAAASLRANAHDFAQELCVEGGAVWALAAEGGEVRQISLTIDGDSLVFETGGSDKDGREDVLYTTWTYNGETKNEDVYRCSYTRTGHAFAGTMSLYDGSYAYLTLDFDADLDSLSPLLIPCGSYALAADGDSAASLTVTSDGSDGADHELSIAIDPGYSDDRLRLSLHASGTSSAAVPSVAPVDVTGYSEYELEDIITDMENALEDSLESAILSLMY